MPVAPGGTTGEYPWTDPAVLRWLAATPSRVRALLNDITAHPNPDDSFGEYTMESRVFTAWFFSLLGELFGPLPTTTGEGRTTRFFARLPAALRALGASVDESRLQGYDIWDLAMLTWVLKHHREYLERMGLVAPAEQARDALYARVFKPSPFCRSPWRGPGEWARAARVFAELGDEHLVRLCVKHIKLSWLARDPSDPLAAGRFEPPLMDGEPATVDKVIFANCEAVGFIVRFDPPELRGFLEPALAFIAGEALPIENDQFFYKSSIVTEDLFISACALGALVAGRRPTDGAVILGLMKYLDAMRTENAQGLGPVASIALLDALAPLQPSHTYFDIFPDDRVPRMQKPRKSRAENELERTEMVFRHLWPGAIEAAARLWRGKNEYSTAAIQIACGYESFTGCQKHLRKLADKGWIAEIPVSERNNGRGRAIAHWYLTPLGEVQVSAAIKEFTRAPGTGEGQGSDAS